MNGIHDLGGMEGFGPIEREEDEPVFHSDWERRMFALNLAGFGAFGPIDRLRHGVERLGARRYLRSTYYEKWLGAVELIAKEFGVLSDEEIETGVAKTLGPGGDPPPNAEIIEAIVKGGVPSSRESGRLEPRFEVGDRVRVRNLQPHGHTRLPSYARGHVGTVERCHGTHVFPDTNAHDQGENPQPLYSVKFDAEELWGASASSGDHLYLDMWEDYLEPES